MKRKIIKLTLSTVMIVIIFGATVFAGTSFQNYSTIVLRFDGNAYTGYQTKITTGASGYIKSQYVGGKYVVDARMETSSSKASWVRDIDTATWCALPSTKKQVSGDKIRLHFSNDWNTPVAVEVKGYWRSN